MNKANKSIGWTDYTWNPIKGLCPVGCWYCYARKIYKRFCLDEHIRFDWYEISDKFERMRKPAKIFVCSTFELFHPLTLKKLTSHNMNMQGKTWRNAIFKIIEKNPQHTFQILTKMPENIDREMPDNVWLGCTVTGEPREMDRNKLDVFGNSKARVKFVSYEPILGYVPFETSDKLDWMILGRLTGYGKRFDHRVHLNMDFIKEIIKSFRKEGTKIFIKNNLKEIWGEKLIQEWPE